MEHSVIDSVLLERINDLINNNVESDKAKRVIQFVGKLYGDLSRDDLRARNDSDLYGAALSLWNLLYSRTTREPTIRVFNPELTRHGWQSTHTIVEIVVEDSPYLVDSVRMTLNRLGVAAHLLIHQPLNLLRDEQGNLLQLLDRQQRQQANAFETVFLIEIDRQTDDQEIARLKQELDSVLQEVALVVSDWQAMRDKLAEVIAQLPDSPFPGSEDERREAIAFLEWVLSHNFTLIGYRRYDIVPIKGDYRIKPQSDSSLGLMRNSTSGTGKLFSELPASALAEGLGPELLVLTKCNSLSRVHRPTHIDYIGIKRFNSKGKVIGEDRFTGLYASTLYNNNAMQIPLIKQRIERAMVASGFSPNSHAYKTLLNILETYPRDEILHAKEHEILEAGMAVLQIQERDLTRLILRRDLFGRYFSCMVYVAKERFNTALRIKTQEILQHALNSQEPVEFTTYFAEGLLARTHYMVRVTNNNFDIDLKAIQYDLEDAVRTWDDKLKAVLLAHYGEAHGNLIRRRFQGGFPAAYRDKVLPSAAVADIAQLEHLSSEHPLGMLFYRPQEETSSSSMAKLKLFHQTEPIHLSDVLPMLENMGLKVIEESPYEIHTNDGKVYWILDFEMRHSGHSPLDLDKSQPLFQDALARIWSGQLENDGFNMLVLGAGLEGEIVAVLRAYARYVRQIGFAFSQNYIAHTLARYPHLASQLLTLFEQRFNPDITRSDKLEEKIKEQLFLMLDQVSNLDDDRIIRLYITLIEATLRTNFYQLDDLGNHKPYVSFKFAPKLIPEVPRPVPEYEIFVYSPRMEGVHLRGGKVARGGLRWSDRREDFRTEILGLVKAQQVKNTVIVPVGAKGGFICKKLPRNGDRNDVLAEGKACYRLLICGMLDLTDNIVAGEVVTPPQVVRHDHDDPYLVVAADKGTATFSDIANGISQQYRFWLGDAFASGGSVGYDHKQMGITARGAWEGVKRHFREVGVDCQTTDFTCIGIGDMSGDVFGNGMLLSGHIRLLAAFNHQHIFIDPAPDAEASFGERQRLFNLQGSSWADYDSRCLSEGGGVYSRSAKSIHLNPQIKELLGTEEQQLTPNALIRELLKLEVDLLWNGGIGTYVKASHETHTDVGDRTNDAVRINGNELRARVVGEGGNLGFTQLGRVQFALGGGRINTDFIDNVGGVDCSDNEVNIKILLNGLVDSGELTVKMRNKLLHEMTDEVAQIVLTNAYRQSQTISISLTRGKSLIRELLRVIHSLERRGLLDRAIEFIPSDDVIAERQAANQNLTRPELAILLAYVKMDLKEQLKELLPEDDPYCRQFLLNAFPEPLRKRYREEILQHPLRREIIATQVANTMTNDMGLDFVQRMMEETGAEMAEIAQAFIVSRTIFEMSSVWRQVEHFDNRLPAGLQLELLSRSRRMVRHISRWFLRNRDRSLSSTALVNRYHGVYQLLRNNLYEVMEEGEVDYYRQQVQELETQQLPNELARYFAHLSTLFSTMDIAEIARLTEFPVDKAAYIYFHLGVKLELHWFLEQINAQPVNNHWQALAQSSFREELDWQQRSLTISVLNTCIAGNSDEMLEQWLQTNAKLLQRWYHLLTDFRTGSSHEFAKFSVALRELTLLNLNCKMAC